MLARFVLAYLSSDEGQKKLADTLHGDSLAQLSPKDLRNMTVPVPSPSEQERCVQEYEAKQRAYENALKQAEHYAASKGTMWRLRLAGCPDFFRQPANRSCRSAQWLKIVVELYAGFCRLFTLN